MKTNDFIDSTKQMFRVSEQILEHFRVKLNQAIANEAEAKRQLELAKSLYEKQYKLVENTRSIFKSILDTDI